MATTTKLLADASNIVNQIAIARGVDAGTRANALAALGRQVDEVVRRLVGEQQSAIARANGLNPVSQSGGD